MSLVATIKLSEYFPVIKDVVGKEDLGKFVFTTNQCTVKILKFWTPQTIPVIVIK